MFSLAIYLKRSWICVDVQFLFMVGSENVLNAGAHWQIDLFESSQLRLVQGEVALSMQSSDLKGLLQLRISIAFSLL
jgi:hypothetical protein